jgi:hypothetical protein
MSLRVSTGGTSWTQIFQMLDPILMKIAVVTGDGKEIRRI